MANLSAREGRDNPYCEVEPRDGREPDFDLIAKNLDCYRWYGPILSHDEERDLIRRVQAGDKQAEERLVRCFGRTVLKIAGEFYGPTRDDLAAAGFNGLLQAIRRFELSRTNGLKAYATPWIRKFIDAETRGKYIDPKTGRLSGRETRADRILHANPDFTAEQLAEEARCSLWKAKEAIAVRDAKRHQEPYSTTGLCADFNGTPDTAEIPDNPPLATSHPMLAMHDVYNPYRQSPHLLHHKTLGRWIERASEDARRLTEWWLKEYHRPCFVKTMGLVGKTDSEKISRREYALMLVEHDLKRVKAWADESLYRYRTYEPPLSRFQKMADKVGARYFVIDLGVNQRNVPFAKLPRYHEANLPPARPHRKPKIRHSIIRGRQVTIEEKRYVRR
jgi:hypothetical protein